MTELEWVWRIGGQRVRLYVGSTGNSRRRVRRWHSTFGSKGFYIVPWGCSSALGPSGRVFGIQWRRLTELDDLVRL